MIKYVFCDLDGTLYHNGVSEEDAKAVKKIEESGRIFNIATGRIFRQGYEMVKNDISLNGYFIAENGSYIYDSELNLIFTGTLSDDLVREVIKEYEEIKNVKEMEAEIYFKFDGNMLVLNNGKAFNSYSDDFLVEPDFASRESFDNKVGNIGFASNHPEELEEIEAKLKEKFSDKLDIYFSSENTINLVPKGVAKNKAIEYVVEKEGVDSKEVATIGDSPNDISMIAGFEHGFAMANAREDVKAVAKYVVNNVAEALEIISKIK